MLIKTTVKTAQFTSSRVKTPSQLVEHDSHIAWHSSIDDKVKLTGKKTILGTTQAQSFHTYSIDQNSETKNFHDWLLLGQEGMQYAAKAFPDAMDRPLDGMSLLVDSSEAFQKWTNPKSTKVETILATGQAAKSAFDVFEPYFPMLQQYNSHVKVAGLLLKIAGEFYIVQKEYEYKHRTT